MCVCRQCSQLHGGDGVCVCAGNAHSSMEEMEGGSAMNSNSGGGSFGASGSDITAMGTCFSTGWEQSTYTDIYRHNTQLYTIQIYT